MKHPHNFNAVLNHMHARVFGMLEDITPMIVKVAKPKHDPLICACISPCEMCKCMPKDVSIH